MNTTAPHYLLFTEAKNIADGSTSGGRWRFVLEQIGTAIRIEEADIEPGVRGERLQLLAVVRGLEALEQPSHVTLITSSKFVGRGIRRGLTQWRQNDWQWERYGQMALIKHHDLWQRIDRTTRIHQINCRIWQFDPPHVRTQVSNESDQAELTGIHAPLAGDTAANQARTKRQVRRLANSNRTGIAQVDSSLQVCPINDDETVKATIGRGNHVKLDLLPTRKAFENGLDQVSRVSNALANKVKPIGQGKAFGYALT